MNQNPGPVSLDDIAPQISVVDSKTEVLGDLAKELHVYELIRRKAMALRYNLETWQQVIISIILFFIFLTLNWWDPP